MSSQMLGFGVGCLLFGMALGLGLSALIDVFVRLRRITAKPIDPRNIYMKTKPMVVSHPLAIPANTSAIVISCPMWLNPEQRAALQQKVRDGLNRPDMHVLMLEGGLTVHAYQEGAGEQAPVAAPNKPDEPDRYHGKSSDWVRFDIMDRIANGELTNALAHCDQVDAYVKQGRLTVEDIREAQLWNRRRTGGDQQRKKPIIPNC